MIQEVKTYFLKCDNCGTSVRFHVPLDNSGFATIVDGFVYLTNDGFLMKEKIRDRILPNITTLCDKCATARLSL